MRRSVQYEFNRKRFLKQRRDAPTKSGGESGAFPLTLTDTRAPEVMTREKASEKAAMVRAKLIEEDDKLEAEGKFDPSIPRGEEWVHWSDNPRTKYEQMKAFMDGLHNGDARFGPPLNDNGDRRVIWRGKHTQLILAGPVIKQKYGIDKTEIDFAPFSSENCVDIGLIEAGPGRRH